MKASCLEICQHPERLAINCETRAETVTHALGWLLCHDLCSNFES